MRKNNEHRSKPAMSQLKIQERLSDTDDPWLCAAFAARITVLALPILTVKVEKGEDFLWFWPSNKRQEYMLKVFLATQCAWNAAWLKSANISKEVNDASNSANGLNYPVARASASAARASASAAKAYPEAEEAFDGHIKIPANLSANPTESVKPAIDTLNHYITAAAEDYTNALQLATKLIYDMEYYKDSKLLLKQPFEDSIDDRYKIFLQQLNSWKEDGFDYWKEWYNDRIKGKILDEKFAFESCMLSQEILAQKPNEINAYLKSLRDADATIPLNQVRAIFIGFGAAGKTSIIRVLHKEPVVEGLEPMTPGIDIRHWPVWDSDNDDVEKATNTDEVLISHLWDFGGQVMAHATHQFFLRSRCLYIVVLDGRTEINANEQAEYWLEHVRSFGAEAPVLLVGNKADLAKVNLDMRYLREKYPNIIDFYPISCTLCGSDYQAEFARFQRDFILHLQKVGMSQVKFTRPHFDVLKTIREISPEHTFLPKDKFAKLCSRYGVKNEGTLDQKWLLDLLDKLGVIIYFPNLPWLHSYLLNPRWLTYGVYTLLYAEQTQRKDGCISSQEAIEILSAKRVVDNVGNDLSYKPEDCRFILDALEQFEIGFRLDNRDQTLLIPALLPSDTPEHGFNKSDALSFDFDFSGFLPRHVMPGFIVRRHREIADDAVWQNGVKLRSGNLDAEALAQADYHERRISLWVRGDQASRYFSVLHDNIIQMLDRMPDLKFKEWVCLSSKNREERAGFRQLLALEAAGESRYICEYGRFALAEVLKIMPAEERKAKIINIDKYIGGNMGDTTIIKNVNNSMLNIKSHLDNARQLIKNIPDANHDIQNILEDMLKQLKTCLEKVPQEYEQDAQDTAEMTESLLEEAKKENPSKRKIKITIEGLLDAAKTVSKIVPEILPVATEIAKAVTGMIL